MLSVGIAHFITANFLQITANFQSWTSFPSDFSILIQNIKVWCTVKCVLNLCNIPSVGSIFLFLSRISSIIYCEICALNLCKIPLTSISCCIPFPCHSFFFLFFLFRIKHLIVCSEHLRDKNLYHSRSHKHDGVRGSQS